MGEDNINYKYFDELTQGNEEVKNNLLNLVKTTLFKDLEEYKKYHSEDNFKEAKRILHNLKPKLKMFNLLLAYEKADEYEKILIQNKKYDKIHKEIVSSFQKLIVFLSD